MFAGVSQQRRAPPTQNARADTTRRQFFCLTSHVPGCKTQPPNKAKSGQRSVADERVRRRNRRYAGASLQSDAMKATIVQHVDGELHRFGANDSAVSVSTAVG